VRAETVLTLNIKGMHAVMSSEHRGVVVSSLTVFAHKQRHNLHN